jgi:hypothetical protein
MEEKDTGIGEAFIEVIRNKMEKQDKKIADMEELMQVLVQMNDKLSGVASLLERLCDSRMKPDSQEIDADKLLEALQDTNTLLQKTQKQTIQHHHHFAKPTWIIISLFLVATLVISDLYMTYKKLDDYMANDIKHRFLKLDTTSYPLQKRLYLVDSLYNARPHFRGEVIGMEDERQYRLEELSKALSLRKEAEEHEKNAKPNNSVK